MKSNGIPIVIRWLLVICSIALIVVLFVPIWRIDLVAPQYPEGLMLTIHASSLGGSVDIINGLNHYIGMKTLHASDFIEFKILPYIIIAIAVCYILVAFLNKYKYLLWLFTIFVVFGVVAMADFWWWEYRYGHNLDPNAAIVVPGMAYQPPLIGFKQLLNFGAYSFPDMGGWIFIIVGCITLISVIYMYKKINSKLLSVISLIFCFISITGCSTSPQPFNIARDQCTDCKMTITNPAFAAQFVTKKGKCYKFDDIICMQHYLNDHKEIDGSAVNFYFIPYDDTSAIIPLVDSYFLKCNAISTPMNGGIIAFSSLEALHKMRNIHNGIIINASELLQ